MTAALHILARGEDDSFQLVWIILLVVVSIVVSIIKKVGARRAEDARRQRPQKQPQQQPQQQPRQPARRPPQPGRTAGPAGPPPAPPSQPEVDLAQQALRAMGLIPAGLQPSEAQQAVVLTPAEPASVRVEEKLEMQRRRQRKLEAQRSKRLAAPKVEKADSATIKGGILQVRPGGRPGAGARTGPSVDLSSPERARRAIIFHEIFSMPKALRQGKELWDV